MDDGRLSIYEGMMTIPATIFAPATGPLTIAVLVLPRASILEVAGILDPMRAANRHLGTEAFHWRIVSPEGAAVPLTCGIELPSGGGLAAARDADALIVIAGYEQTTGATPALIRTLAHMAPGFRAIGGIDAGPWVMARAGLLNGHRATIHWEDAEDFAARHPAIEVLPNRYVIDRSRFTAAGAGPAADLMHHLIGTRHGPVLARQVAASFLTTPQAGSEPQTTATPRRLDPRTAAAVARMERLLDAPEPAARTAAAVGLSPRHMETLFRRALGTTPGAYALSLRIAAARRMVEDTHHPLAEIALRTGFSSPSSLSRAFRRAYGAAPGTLRKS